MHSGFNLYWPSGTNNRKDMQVLTAVRKDILHKIIVENRTNLVSYSYYIVLDIRELNPVSEEYSRKTRVVNFLDNKIGNGCVCQGSSLTIRQAIQEISWRQVIQG